MPHQIPLLQSDSRFKIVCAGRRWGKSIAGLVSVVRGHGPKKGHFRGAVDGGTIWWVAPTYGIAMDIWRYLKRALWESWDDKSELEKRIVLPNGGSVTVKSSDNPDSLRGIGLDGIVMDEAAFIKEEAWTEAIRPALSDKQGWGMFISTPNGLNWYYDMFRNAEHRDGWERWHLPTAQNPIIPQEEIELAKIDIGSQKFAQEYLADFIKSTGGKFDRTWFNIVEAAPEHLVCSRFWDLAATLPRVGTDPDYTAGVKLGKAVDGRLYVLDVARIRESPGSVERLIRATAEMDGVGTYIGIEQEPGSSGVNTVDHYVRRILQGYVVKGYKTTGSKEARANPIAAQAEAKNLYLVRGPWLEAFIAELEVFPSKGVHDDQVDALSGAFGMLVDVNMNQPTGIIVSTPRLDPFEGMDDNETPAFEGM